MTTNNSIFSSFTGGGQVKVFSSGGSSELKSFSHVGEGTVKTWGGSQAAESNGMVQCFAADYGNNDHVAINVTKDYSFDEAQSYASDYASKLGNMPADIRKHVETVNVVNKMGADGGTMAACEGGTIHINQSSVNSHASVNFGSNSGADAFNAAVEADCGPASGNTGSNAQADFAQSLMTYVAVKSNADKVDPAVTTQVNKEFGNRFGFFDKCDLPINGGSTQTEHVTGTVETTSVHVGGDVSGGTEDAASGSVSGSIFGNASITINGQTFGGSSTTSGGHVEVKSAGGSTTVVDTMSTGSINGGGGYTTQTTQGSVSTGTATQTHVASGSQGDITVQASTDKVDLNLQTQIDEGLGDRLSILEKFDLGLDLSGGYTEQTSGNAEIKTVNAELDLPGGNGGAVDGSVEIDDLDGISVNAHVSGSSGTIIINGQTITSTPAAQPETGGAPEPHVETMGGEACDPEPTVATPIAIDIPPVVDPLPEPIEAFDGKPPVGGDMPVENPKPEMPVAEQPTGDYHAPTTDGDGPSLDVVCELEGPAADAPELEMPVAEMPVDPAPEPEMPVVEVPEETTPPHEPVADEVPVAAAPPEGEDAADMNGGSCEAEDHKAGDDTEQGTDGEDVLDGGRGNDTLSGGAGNDTIYGGSGSDTLDGGAGDDLIQGHCDDDTMNGGDGNDSLEGGKGDDTMYGDAGIDYMDGGVGNDTMYGGDGDDVLYAGEGDDTIYGDDGDDTLMGSTGNDTIYGGTGNDGLIGGDGNDIMDGGVGDDQLYGDAGDDTFKGSEGNDTFVGGTGTDTVIFQGSKEDYTFTRNEDGSTTAHSEKYGTDVMHEIEMYGFENSEQVYSTDDMA